jgi:hypothetical protein
MPAMGGYETEAMSDISRQIWDMKYRLKKPDGTPVDGDVAETWARVALAAAAAEAPEKRSEHAVARQLSLPSCRTHLCRCRNRS